MICARCGIEFTEGRKRKYCTPRCRELAFGRNLDYKPMSNCLICGEPLSKGQKKYCSQSCNSKASYWRRNKNALPVKKRNEIRKQKSIRSRTKICKQCGETFIMPRSGKKTEGTGSFCSRKCRWEYECNRLMLGGYNTGDCCKIYFNKCKVCEKLFTTNSPKKKACSKNCNRKRLNKKYAEYQRRIYDPKPKRKIKCIICDRLFYSSRPTIKTCSKLCSYKNFRLNRPNGDRARARKYGVRYEYVNPIKVFERDGWHCQICGKHTPKRNRRKRYPNAPQLDHRVPISKGGGHLYSNVQCACLRCNEAKNNKDNRGQFPIFEIKTNRYPVALKS